MGLFTEIIKRNIKLTVVVVILLLLFVAGSVARCTQLQTERAEQQAIQTTEQEQQKQAKKEPEEKQDDQLGKLLSSNDKATTPTDAQEQIIKSYNNDQLTITENISRFSWTTSATTQTQVTFDGNTYTVTVGGKIQDTKPYAISAYAGNPIAGELTQASDGSDTIVMSILKKDGTTALLKFSQIYDGETLSYTLETDAFTGKKEVFVSAPQNHNLSVEGFTTELAESLNQVDLDAVKASIESEIHNTYPTAKTANWDTTLAISYTTRTASLNFTLDDVRKNKVLVTINLDDGSVTIGGIR